MMKTNRLDAGIDLDEVEADLASGASPAFIYTVSSGHNPLSVSMSLDKRKKLIALSKKYGTPIIEDDPYGLLNYSNNLFPPLRSFDEDWVCYIGSFSKIVSPSLRVGWLIVPPSLQSKLSYIKEGMDLDIATFSQHVLNEFLGCSDIEKHLSTLVSQYRLRRDAMDVAIRKYFPEDVIYNIPDVGFFFWLKLPEGIDAATLLKISVENFGVSFIPGEAFLTDPALHCQSASYIRLCFSNNDPAKIDAGIRDIGKAIELYFEECNSLKECGEVV